MNKQKVPELRFPGFTGEWVEKNLLELSENGFSNGVFNDPKMVGSGYKLINVKEMYEGDVINYKNLTLVDIPKTEFQKNKVLKGDIFFTRSSLVKDGIAFSNIFIDDFEDVTYDGHLIRMRPKKNLLVSKYFSYQLKTQTVRRQLVVRGKTTTMTTIGQDDIGSVETFIPTLPEQKKIADFLTDIDTKIEKLTRKKELIAEYKKGVMQKIFSQEIRFKDENGKNYPDWEEKPGSYVFESVSNKEHNSDLPILAITQEYGAIPRDLIDYKISVTDKSVETYKVVEIGDFIISLRSFQGGIEYSNYKGICSPAYLILKPKIKIENMFFKFYFKTDMYIKKLNQKLEGIRDGKMISYNYFSDANLIVPSLPEQKKIADFLVDLDTRIQHIDKGLLALKEFKKGLLQGMFT